MGKVQKQQFLALYTDRVGGWLDSRADVDDDEKILINLY
jgi:hypothetical protein